MLRIVLVVLGCWLTGTAWAVSPVSIVAMPTPPKLRLGEAVTPLGYQARLRIDPKESSFSGEVEVRVRLNAATRFFWINGTRLQVASAEWRGGDGTVAAARPLIPGDDFIGLSFDRELPAGEATLHFRYSGSIDAMATRGVFRQRDGGDWYVFTQFQAQSARRAFPCFDEPQWKTPWQLTLEVPAGDVAAANTPETGAETLPDGFRRLRFAPSKPLPSYLVAFAVGPFAVVDGGVAGQRKVPVRYLAPKGRGGELAFVAKATPKLVAMLEDYFGQPYPFEKLDSVAVPQTVGFGAMENAGLITYSSSFMLARPGAETGDFRRDYVGIAAHELAHQWFGNLVTLAWWDDLWLNESFATWMGQKIARGFDPGWEYGLKRNQSRHRAIAVDRLQSTRVMREPVISKEDISAAFDRITYDKGGAVLSMFEAKLTPERFRNGVRAYLVRHAFGSATAQDFLAALREAADAGNHDVAESFSRFVERPGVPQIAVDIRCQPGQPATMTLTQSRFLPQGSAAEAQAPWTTPVCYRLGNDASGAGDATRCVDVGAAPVAVELLPAGQCPAWVLANPGGGGYYIAAYSPEWRGRLLDAQKQLNAGDLSALATDLAALAQAGKADYEEVLVVAARLAEHTHPTVVQAAVTLADSIAADRLDAGQQTAFAHWVRTHFGKRAQQLGWQSRAGDDDSVQRLRRELLPFVAVRGDEHRLAMQAQQLARRWLQRPQNIDAAMADGVLQTAAATGGPATFEALLGRLLALPDRKTRRQLLTALARTPAPALQQRLFTHLKGQAVDAPERLTVVEAALENPRTRHGALTLLAGDFDAWQPLLPTDAVVRFPTYARGVCTAGEREEFVKFLSDRASRLPGGARRYRQAIEEIDLCVALQSRRQASLEQALGGQRPAATAGRRG